ncbi:DUF1822 family protein [Iningainema tapete]|nr:DUF1822 family protein [Iningainema tapete]
MNSTMNHYLTIHLEQKAFESAHKFAAQQASVEKARQVSLNTLAVYAVNEFVQEELGFSTDFKAGDSWNPFVRIVHDVADLIIPDLGILECRPMQPEDRIIYLPPEVRENRIAYVAVQFHEQLDKVKLRGFIPAVELGKYPEEIEISQLQPIEELIDYLYRLETAISILSPEIEEVEASVREILQGKSIAEIAAQLERVYRTYDSSDWWDEGGKVLAGSSKSAGGSVREGGLTRNVSDVEVELRDLAEELLEKLAEVWGDAA